MVASEDQLHCMPCASGLSAALANGRVDCSCGATQAILERGGDGALLPAKTCQTCAAGFSTGAGAFGGERSSCAASISAGCATGMLRAGDICFSGQFEWFGKTNSQGVAIDQSFSVQNAKAFRSYDAVEDLSKLKWWQKAGFSRGLGLQYSAEEATEILEGSQATTVDSSAMLHLYQMCTIKCIRVADNTGCQCLSNLCRAAGKELFQFGLFCIGLRTWLISVCCSCWFLNLNSC